MPNDVFLNDSLMPRRIGQHVGAMGFLMPLISLDREMELWFVSRHLCQKCSGSEISKYLTVLMH